MGYSILIVIFEFSLKLASLKLQGDTRISWRTSIHHGRPLQLLIFGLKVVWSIHIRSNSTQICGRRLVQSDSPTRHCVSASSRSFDPFFKPRSALHTSPESVSLPRYSCVFSLMLILRCPQPFPYMRTSSTSPPATYHTSSAGCALWLDSLTT